MLLDERQWTGRIYSGGLGRCLDLDRDVNEEPPAPFGGFGASSNGGRFGGVANLELRTEWQWTTSRDAAEPFPF